MGSVVVQSIHGREGSLAIGNQYIGRYCIVATQTNLYLASLITVTLFLVQHLGLIAMCWSGWRSEHTVEHLLSSHLAPFIKVFDIAVSPC